MRVLMTADTVGGVWTYSLELARALEPFGVEIALATMGRLPTLEQRAEARSLPNVKLYAAKHALEWMDEPWAEVERAGEWLRILADDFAPDIVHLNGYTHGALDWGAPVMIVAHSCVLTWWRAVKGEPAPETWRRYRLAVGDGLRSAHLVVAPTRAMLGALEREHGAPRRARVIHNALGAVGLQPGEQRPFVLAVGRLWDEAKNIEALSRVATKLSWPVRIAGNAKGPNREERQFANVESLGLLSREALADELRAASIFALPARYEPFGLAALEAAHAGCALVLGDIESLREVWEDDALYVEPGDHDSIRDAIQLLIDDPSLRRRMAARARSRARTYRADSMASAYMRAYGELIAARTPEVASCAS